MTKDFFVELPIQIKGRGDYHAFGAFTSALAALPRIVTVDDFSIEPIADGKSKSEIPVLGLSISAKTYRYNDSVDQNKNNSKGVGTQKGSTT
jgi:type IV pilus assembly protein PilO